MTNREGGPVEASAEKAAADLAVAQLANLGQAVQVLKRVPRMGWYLRGVAPGEVENVAAHSYGVALLGLALAMSVSPPVDTGRLLAMCLLHDLAEAVLSDLPGPTNRYLPANAKAEAERQVLQELLADLPFADEWLDLWDEYRTGNTIEAQLVQDADKLDMVMQAAAYERAGRRGLGEFWDSLAGRSWHTGLALSLFEHLQQQRQ